MVVSQDAGHARYLRLASRTTLGSIKVGTMPHWIELAGGRALVTNEGSDDLSIVDLASGSVEGRCTWAARRAKSSAEP